MFVLGTEMSNSIDTWTVFRWDGLESIRKGLGK